MSYIRRSNRLQLKHPRYSPKKQIKRVSTTTNLDEPLNARFHGGDVTLISADEMNFQVQSYHLISASIVFRDMFAGPTTPTITTSKMLDIRFTDQDIESSMTIYLFLSMLCGHSLPCPENTKLNDVEKLLTFITKYDCPALLRMVLHVLHSFIHPDINPRALFALATSYDALDICVNILKKPQGWTYEPPSTGEEDEGLVVGSDVLDPRGMTLADAQTIRANYFWGLARGFRVVDGEPKDAEDWGKVAEEFERVMRGQMG